MKVLVIVGFVAVLSALVSAVDEETDMKYRKECQKEFNISQEDLDMWIGGALPQNSPNFKYMLFCYMRKLEVMDEKGVIVQDKMKEAIIDELGSEEAADKMMELCMQNNVGGAQGAWDLEDCYLKNKGNVMAKTA